MAITSLSSQGDSLQRYLAELEKALPNLPPEMQRYVRECSLHDAQFVGFLSSPTDSSLVIEFVGDCCSVKVPLSFARRFRLTYRGVISFSLRAIQDSSGYPVVTMLDTVDHDRICLLSSGEIEHQIVFLSEIRLSVRFRGFELWYEDFEYVAL